MAQRVFEIRVASNGTETNELLQTGTNELLLTNGDEISEFCQCHGH